MTQMIGDKLKWLTSLFVSALPEGVRVQTQNSRHKLLARAGV
jgi:hypothetical protein